MRPTLYKPEYCETVISVGEEGGWLAEMAVACDRVCVNTLDNWSKKNPDFLRALDIAKTLSRAFLEKDGRHGIRAEKYNAPLWKAHMQARFREDYTEQKKVDHTNSDRSLAPRVLSDVEKEILARSGYTPQDDINTNEE